MNLATTMNGYHVQNARSSEEEKGLFENLRGLYSLVNSSTKMSHCHLLRIRIVQSMNGFAMKHHHLV